MPHVGYLFFGEEGWYSGIRAQIFPSLSTRQVIMIAEENSQRILRDTHLECI